MRLRTQEQRLREELRLEEKVAEKLWDHIRETVDRRLVLHEEIRREGQADYSNADLPLLGN